jgi:formate hydrogenlyase subunit 4
MIEMNAIPLINFFLALILAPLLLGVINRTKAIYAGRRGQPLLQVYFDLWKLVHKGAAYSQTTTWVFRAGPVIGLAAVLGALLLAPFAGASGILAFSGDILLLAYFLGVMRFFTVLAALDTGSSFEGMGASREVLFSALAEPAFLLGLAALARETGSFSLSGIFPAISTALWLQAGPVLALVAAALLIVFLAENARIPVDDPNTHLELTMIHEVMVLDHSGPDFAFILYGGALKMWVLGAFIINTVVPVRTGNPWLDIGPAVAGMFCLAVLVGVIESSMARLRLLRVPLLLVGATVLSALAFVLILR